MKDPDEFDQYYKDVRTRLLVLTYCLTGDLPSSRAAVRDAFVVTWHHWRKVSRLEDPEAWTRIRACRHAQRRHTAKLWHREKGLDPEVKATLDALGKLPMTQRRMLLLTELTTASLAEISREVGLPRTDAERELQTATAQFAVHRDVPTTTIRTVFDPVREHIEASPWPRPTIIRRAGMARRRTHTVIGVGATVAALIVTGTLVTDAAGVRPTLSRERMDAAGHGTMNTPKAAPEPVDVPEDSMLAAEKVEPRMPGTGWTETGTDANTAGDGLVLPCQESRYADPRTASALVRSFESTSGKAPATLTQASEVSVNLRAAGRAYNTEVDWFAGCDEDRAQLLQTREVENVGDEAIMVVLHTWDDPETIVVAGVARTGQFVTNVVSRSPVGKEPSLKDSAKLLTEAVNGLCSEPDAGACASVPRLRVVPPVPVAPVPAMLAEVDLPPVAGVTLPWVGTEPQQARTNAAATGCDDTDFSKGSMSNDVTRTFLIPDAKLADQFGLTETVGSLPEKQARAFVERVRGKLALCPDKQMGTEVERVAHETGKHRDLSVWHVTAEISDDKSVRYLMGIVRDRTSVAQVGFIPDGKVGMGSDAFIALVQRALARLDAMPAPRTR